MCSNIEVLAISFNGYDKLIDKIAKELSDGKIKPSTLNSELVQKIYADLESGAKDGYGKKWEKFPKDGKGSTPRELKKNLFAFSGAKTYAQLVAINDLLVDKDGKLRPYNEFEQLARGINRQYNKNYLQAEYQTARTAAQMAEKWERLQETKDLFPNLKYRTAGDSRVRPEHEKLDGIIKPLDDPFWSTYYPPLDFRCRCDVVATAEDATEYKEKDLPPVQFKGNVGKDKEIFRKNGSFFKLAATNKDATRNIELTKLNAPYEQAYKSAKGKKVEVNIYADEKDLESNVETAIVITDSLNLNVQVRPHIDTNKAKGLKNPEYFINGNVADLKSDFKANNYKSINNAFKAAREQGLESIVFDFTTSFKQIDPVQINRWVLSNINDKRGKQFKEVIFVYNRKAIIVKRENIVNKQLLPELEKLKAGS
ncbi:phage minor head protein [Flavobacterium beibuense]|uniref:phage minor head protein n=1 Tax=Flavobacterium beibuense TaxID=657326 RepID=UPI003A950C94